MNCPKCEIGELEHDSTEISVDWVHIYIKCDSCGVVLSGDIQIDHLEEVDQ